MHTLKQPHDPGVFREFCSPWDTSQIWALPHGGLEPGHGCMCPRQQQAAASCLGPGLLLTHPIPHTTGSSAADAFSGRSPWPAQAEPLSPVCK